MRLQATNYMYYLHVNYIFKYKVQIQFKKIFNEQKIKFITPRNESHILFWKILAINPWLSEEEQLNLLPGNHILVI